jgi:hypothetical protein
MKSETDILKEQVDILKKLVETQELLIQEMRKNTPYVSIPSVWTVDPCQHEYPNPWMGTVPPSCRKCGKQAEMTTFTSTSSGSLRFWDDDK